jgi:hypothetical protein
MTAAATTESRWRFCGELCALPCTAGLSDLCLEEAQLMDQRLVEDNLAARGSRRLSIERGGQAIGHQQLRHDPSRDQEEPLDEA